MKNIYIIICFTLLGAYAEAKTFSESFRHGIHPGFQGVNDVRKMLELEIYQEVLDQAEQLLEGGKLDLQTLEGLAKKMVQSAAADEIESEKFLPLLENRLRRLTASDCHLSWTEAVTVLKLELSGREDWSWIGTYQDDDLSWKKFCKDYRSIQDFQQAIGMETKVLANKLVYAALKEACKTNKTYRTVRGLILKPEYALMSYGQRHQVWKKQLGQTGLNTLTSIMQKVLNSKTLTEQEVRHSQPYFTPMSFPKQIQANLKQYIDDLGSMLDNRMDPYEIAAFAHQRMVEIHPYLDANGRMARLVMNIVLIQHHLEPIIFTRDICYTAALERGMADYKVFAGFLRNPVCSELNFDEL